MGSGGKERVKVGRLRSTSSGGAEGRAAWEGAEGTIGTEKGGATGEWPEARDRGLGAPEWDL